MVIPCLCSFSARIRGEIVRVLYRPPRKKSPDQRSGDSWWSIVHSTRTQHLFTGDGFRIVREVEIEHDPVVKNVDRVDKGINDLPLVFHVPHVTLAEFFKDRKSVV